MVVLRADTIPPHIHLLTPHAIPLESQPSRARGGSLLPGSDHQKTETFPMATMSDIKPIPLREGTFAGLRWKRTRRMRAVSACPESAGMPASRRHASRLPAARAPASHARASHIPATHAPASRPSATQAPARRISPPGTVYPRPFSSRPEWSRGAGVEASWSGRVMARRASDGGRA